MNIGGRARIDKTLDSALASDIAVQALLFIAAEPERIERFLSLTGVVPADLRQLAPKPSFQLAILDHLATDEDLLVAFTGEAGLPPETIGRARKDLGGGDAE